MESNQPTEEEEKVESRSSKLGNIANYAVGKVRKLQRFVRGWIITKQVNTLSSHLLQLRKETQAVAEIVEELGRTVKQPKEAEIQEISKNISGGAVFVPCFDAWFIVIEFLPQVSELRNIMRVCKMFNEICQLNVVWHLTYQVTFPLQYRAKQRKIEGWEEPTEESKKKEANLDPEEMEEEDDIEELFGPVQQTENVNVPNEETTNEEVEMHKKPSELEQPVCLERLDWIRETRVQWILTRTARKMIDSVVTLKEEGNDLFKQGNIDEALKKYEVGLEVCQQNGGANEMEPNLTIDMQEEYHKLRTVLLSNSSLVLIQKGEFIQAMQHGFKAKEALKKVREIVDDQQRFKQLYGLLEENIDYRIQHSWRKVAPMLIGVRHSDVPNQQLQLGSLLVATEEIRGSIFNNSKVLMTEFVRLLWLILLREEEKQSKESLSTREPRMVVSRLELVDQ